MPIGVNDWYLFAMAPDNGINLQTFNMQNPTVMLAIRIVVLFIILILYIIWRQIRYRVMMEGANQKLEDLNERLRARNESLKLKAENDLLTGLYNKVTSELAIEDYLSNEGKAGRHALFIIDLDNFKGINDELGHFYGDKALTEVADAIDHCLRTTDIKGRIGGDEFIVLLKNISTNEDATHKAAEICYWLKRIRLSKEIPWKVSGTIGISIYPHQSENFKDLFLKADKAMYYAKGLEKGSYYIYNDKIEN
jgi:diguanylate cyclase (GGDEF)-like protein